MAYPGNLTLIQTEDFGKEQNPLPIYAYFETKSNLTWYYNQNSKMWVSSGGGTSGNAAWGSIGGNITSQTDLISALTFKQNTSEKNQNNGYAGLDNTGKILANQIPVLPDYRPIKIIISINGQINFTIPTAPVNFSNPFLFLNGVLQVLGTANSDYNISNNLLVWTSQNVVLETNDELIFYYK